nr:uncharacterized mitochondrial protein AtMg00810-like [Tanacetum cinerariifolium]
TLKGKGIVDSEYSRHMTGNKTYLVEHHDFNGGLVAFGGSKGQITDTKCLVLSPDFKFPDENQVLLKVPRQNNMYSFNLENIISSGDLACLIAKTTVDESNKWHRRMTTPVLLVIKESNTRPPPITAENKANKTAGPKEANNSVGTQDNIDEEILKWKLNMFKNTVYCYYGLFTSTVKSSEAKNGDENLIGDTGSKTNEEPVYQKDQAFLEELARLKRQKKRLMVQLKLLERRLLKVKQREDGIFISQDKYVAEILKKFDFMSVKTASTPIKTKKPLVKDVEAADVDVHLYRSMIGSLMYLTDSRPDIMYAFYACSRFQVTPKTSHLHAMKRIFRYLKGQPKLGLWYPRESAFDLEAYSNSDYARENLDRKSTTRESNVRLWLQFYETNIYIDNESTICIVKNPVFHSKTKHIEIRHHFLKDAYKKKLIQGGKINKVRVVIQFVDRQKVSTARPKLNTASQNLIMSGKSLYNMVAYLENTEGNAQFHRIVDFLLRIIHLGTNYVVNEMSYTDKVKVINAEAEGISAAGETLNDATLTEAKMERTATGKETSNPFMAGSSSKSRLKNNKVFEYILLVIKMPKLKKHEASAAVADGGEVVMLVPAGVAAAVGVSGGHGGGGAAAATVVGTPRWWLRGLKVCGVVGGGGSGGCYGSACRRWVADLIDRDTRRHF